MSRIPRPHERGTAPNTTKFELIIVGEQLKAHLAKLALETARSSLPESAGSMSPAGIPGNGQGVSCLSAQAAGECGALVKTHSRPTPGCTAERWRFEWSGETGHSGAMHHDWSRYPPCQIETWVRFGIFPEVITPNDGSRPAMVHFTGRHGEPMRSEGSARLWATASAARLIA